MARAKSRSGRAGEPGQPAGSAQPDLSSVPGSLREFYELGREVDASARAAGSKNAAYRAFAEQGTGENRAKLSLLCFERISPAQLVRLGRIRIGRGKPLAEKHLRHLAGVGDAKTRRSLIAAIGREGWTAEQLSEAIRRLKGDRAGTGGPKLTRPASLEEGLDQVDGHCRAWLKRHDALWSEAEATWLDVPARVEDADELAGRLVEVRGRLRRMASAALALDDRLAKVESRLRAGQSQLGEPVIRS